MNILITGGSGYLANSLANFLSLRGMSITLASRGKIDKLYTDGIRVIKIDWESQESINNILKNQEIVIHAAGMNAIESALRPSDAIKYNSTYTQKLSSSAKNFNIQKFIYFSTAHVYRSPLLGIINERSAITNDHPYAQSHYLAEKLAIEELDNSNVKLYNLRISNIFGPPSNNSSNCWNLIINYICSEAIKSGKVQLKNNGNQIRDFLSINEFNLIINFLINNKETNKKVQTLNIGSGNTFSINEICELIKPIYYDIFKKDLKIFFKNELITKKNEERLEFNIKKLIEMGYNFEYEITSQLKALLNYCNNEFTK